MNRPIPPKAVVAVGGCAHGHLYDSETGKRSTIVVKWPMAIPHHYDDVQNRLRIMDQITHSDRYMLEPFDFMAGSICVSGWMYRWESMSKHDAHQAALGILLAGALFQNTQEPTE